MIFCRKQLFAPSDGLQRGALQLARAMLHHSGKAGGGVGRSTPRLEVILPSERVSLLSLALRAVLDGQMLSASACVELRRILAPPRASHMHEACRLEWGEGTQGQGGEDPLAAVLDESLLPALRREAGGGAAGGAGNRGDLGWKQDLVEVGPVAVAPTGAAGASGGGGGGSRLGLVPGQWTAAYHRWGSPGGGWAAWTGGDGYGSHRALPELLLTASSLCRYALGVDSHRGSLIPDVEGH
jgi:hypothetical protein